MWWMPTTKEFGPRGAYGDWEQHEKVATRFGFSTTQSPEQRFTKPGGGPDNTTLRLADSVNVFDTGALAPGVTVDTVDYRILSFDAGVKYRGLLPADRVYNRWLDNFKADGVLPGQRASTTRASTSRAAFYPMPKKLEALRARRRRSTATRAPASATAPSTSAGMNYYPFDTRNHRLNVQVINVNHSPVSSAFGYYVGGQDGTTVVDGVLDLLLTEGDMP